MDSKVSIIMAAYNAEKYIEQALDSIMNQTYKNIELIAVNDGSTDSTQKILEKYEKLGISVLHQKNKGQNAALNFGYKFSSGRFIKFIDADDYINEKSIELQVAALTNNPNHIAYGDWARFYHNDLKKSEFKKWNYLQDMSPIDFLTSHPTGPLLQCGIMLIPRNIIEKVGLWDERLLLFNDTEFFTRVLLASDGTKYTPGARLYYRAGHSTNLTSQKDRKFFECTLLGAQLISKHLLKIENTDRTRKLVANLLQMRVYSMYPLYPDLESLYENEIRNHGGSDLINKSGLVFNILMAVIGWRLTFKIKAVIYKLGYKPVLKLK